MAEAENRFARIREELFGIIILFLSVFLFLTLVSYRADDPSFFARGGQGIKNYGGLVGSYLSAVLFQSIGLGAFLLFVLAFFAAGFKLFRREKLIVGRSRVWLALRVFGLGLLLVCCSGLVSLISPQMDWSGDLIKSGGWMGFLLAKALKNLLSAPGAYGFSLLGILVGMVLGFNISVVKAAGMAYKAGGNAWEFVADRVRQRWERRWERRKRLAGADEQKKLFESYQKSEPKIKEVSVAELEASKTPMKVEPEAPRQEKLSFMPGSYVLPSLKLLDAVPKSTSSVDRDSLLLRARLLEKKLLDFGVAGEVEEVQPGPVITMYEYKPASGIKVNRVANLSDDLACALSALSVRIIAPIPGKGVVGIEIPNQERETVYFKELIASSAYQNQKSLLTLALGKGITGEPFVIDLRRAPHLLVAGATGSGKSVSLNAMIMSVLHRSTPEQVRMLMIDPKRLELTTYEGIPHLLTNVISEPKEAAVALKWAVAEMENRYRTLAHYGARNIDSFNRLVEEGKKGRKGKRKRKDDGSTLVLDRVPEKYPAEQLPLILIIIDELADLMMVAQRDCEASITRLAQMARAAGIHLIVATQRPSVDVITGLIKANFSARISFQVASKVDSRTILDQMGAEKLLGMGDMLFLAPGTNNLIRVHGAYVSEPEIKRVVGFWKKQGRPEYNTEIVRAVPEDAEGGAAGGVVDDLYEQAVEVVVRTRQASVSMLQRKLRVGYNRSARMIEQMEIEGIIGPSDGVKAREVLWDVLRLEQRLSRRMKGVG